MTVRTFFNNHPNLKLVALALVYLFWLTLFAVYMVAGGWWIIFGIISLLNSVFAWDDVRKAYKNT